MPTRSLDGVGGFGSNVLLFVTTLLVLKGLFLPEDVRQGAPLGSDVQATRRLLSR